MDDIPNHLSNQQPTMNIDAINTIPMNNSTPSKVHQRNKTFSNIETTIDTNNTSTTVVNITRMIIFESGLVYASNTNGDSILLEPHCMTFTFILHNGMHRQHVSKYAPRETHYLLKNAILFKNTHITTTTTATTTATSSSFSNINNNTFTSPFFCPDVYQLLNIPFHTSNIEKMNGDNNDKNSFIDRIHWPKFMKYNNYCIINNEDESINILSTDGFSKLSLSPHEQIVHVSYPFIIPVTTGATSTTTTTTTMTTTNRSSSPTSNQTNTTTTNNNMIHHININHIFPSTKCPSMFQHPFTIAKKLSDSTLSVNHNDDDDDDDGKDNGNLYVVDTLLPKAIDINDDEYKLNLYDWHDVTSCVSPLGLSWKEECVELGKGVVPMHVPTIERVLVEWNENHTIWFIGPHIPDNKTMKETRQKNSIETAKDTREDTLPLVEYGLLLHNNNAYLKILYEKGFHHSDNGHIHEYLMHTNTFYSTYTCLACKDEHKDSVRYVQRLHRHHEACVTLQMESFVGTNKKIISNDDALLNNNGDGDRKLTYEDLTGVSLPIQDIAFKMKLRDVEKEKLLYKIEQHRIRQPDIDMVLEQTRRFIERQKLEERR